MAMQCTVCVVRKKDEDLYSAFHADGEMRTHKWDTLPSDAPRADVELYAVNTERTHLGVTPKWVTREEADAWVAGLGQVRRVQ